ncbi:MAG: hypothetical protein Kow00122_08250 [Thermoleophilia bacterium]
MRTCRLYVFLTVLLAAGLVALIGCGGGGQVEDQPTTAEDLKTRMLAWVEESHSKVEQPAEGPSSAPRFRHYGAGGLPVLLQTEMDQPFPGPILYDGSSHYYQSKVSRGGVEAGQWIEIPQGLLESEDGRRRLGDLLDTLTWFWIFDPLTLLKASEPSGELEPVKADSSWTYKGRVTAGKLAAFIPSGLAEDQLIHADDWEVEVTARADGAITHFTLHAQLDTEFSYTLPWEEVDAAPVVPDDTVDIEEVLQAQ